MKLYDFPKAPNPRIVNIFLAEKGIEIEREEIDLMTRAQLDSDFAKVNPMLDVPVLELDDGTHISQISAICHCLEGMYPDKPLLGSTPSETGTILMWHHVCFMNGLGGVADALRNTSPAFADRALPGPNNYPQIPALAERGIQRVHNFWEFLDQRLADNTYVAGDNFSLADITAYVTVGFAGWIQESVPESCSNIQRWYQELSKRPSMAV